MTTLSPSEAHRRQRPFHLEISQIELPEFSKRRGLSFLENKQWAYLTAIARPNVFLGLHYEAGSKKEKVLATIISMFSNTIGVILQPFAAAAHFINGIALLILAKTENLPEHKERLHRLGIEHLTCAGIASALVLVHLVSTVYPSAYSSTVLQLCRSPNENNASLLPKWAKL